MAALYDISLPTNYIERVQIFKHNFFYYEGDETYVAFYYPEEFHSSLKLKYYITREEICESIVFYNRNIEFLLQSNSCLMTADYYKFDFMKTPIFPRGSGIIEQRYVYKTLVMYYMNYDGTIYMITKMADGYIMAHEPGFLIDPESDLAKYIKVYTGKCWIYDITDTD